MFGGNAHHKRRNRRIRSNRGKKLPPIAQVAAVQDRIKPEI